MRATEGLDEEMARLYYDLVLSTLDEASRMALEEMMNTQKYEYQSYLARENFAKGKAEGKAKGKAEGLR